MKRSQFILPILAAAGILGIASQSVVAQTTIFSDTFVNGSTVQTVPSAPTANSTTYEWFQQGGAPASPTMMPGDLHLAGRTTSSSIAEMQALFTATPVTLGTVGQSLNFTITFTDTQNIVPASANSTINIGLFNSHGAAPVTGVRLDAIGSGTGGAMGWNGYVARIGGSGASAAQSQIFTRAPQTGDGSTNKFQDALFNGASSSSTYNNPPGTTIATTGGPLSSLTQGNVYTLSYTLTLTAPGSLRIDNNLYNGAVADVNQLILSQTGTTSSSIETTYDALGFGFRYSSTSAANSVDVSSITVTSAVPEPSIIAMAGLAAVGLRWHFRRFRG